MVGTNRGAIPATLRRTNERAIIGLLMQMGTASRADLAKAAGLSQPTTGKITSELLELDILQEIEAAPVSEAFPPATNRVGRPGRMLRLNCERNRFLALELDVAETRLAAMPIAMREDQWAAAFPTTTSPATWQGHLRRALAKIPIEGLWGILVSVPGVVDEKTGKVLFSPNLHWTEKVNLAAVIQEVCDLPVLLVQEIRALALGHLTVNPKARDFLLVDFGNGVGGAIVKGGRLFINPLPLNGELGHTPVPGNQRVCGCGARGCVETLVGRHGLLESFAATHPRSPSTWRNLLETVEKRGLDAWLAISIEAACASIAGALNVLGLRHVVITGFLDEFPSGVRDALAQGIRRGTMWARFGEVSCEFAHRHRAAGLAGVGLDRFLIPAAHYEGLRSRHLQPLAR